MPKSKIFLPDVNVWLALVSARHVHNDAAVRWLERIGEGQLAFCRVSQMGLLRLLTNTRVMGVDVLAPSDAWRVYEEMMRDARVRFLAERGGLEAIWKGLTQGPATGAWTDAYLMAFAQAQGLHVVTFDRGFERFGDARTVLLTAGQPG
jgi:toxin-antitoxin system PIN domain toxin